MSISPYTLESSQIRFLHRIRTTSRLYHFMSRIRVDPLKVEVILNLPPPSRLRQLQSLQGKANFLRRFIPNYAEITLGFMQLLKKGSEFVWDTITNKAFEALKLSLTCALLLFPPDYSHDYFLYLAASDYTITMVLV
jgi:hypothetical protein